MSEEFTIKMFTDLVQSYRKSQSRDYAISMSLKGIIYFDVAIQLSFYKKSGRMWFTDTPKATNWIEITPYNKGNLWKIRCYYNKTFLVYYGTIKKAYCSTLYDALIFIPEQLIYFKLK